MTRRCGDIDECASGVAACVGAGKTCVNTIGSFRCECQRGFRKSGMMGTDSEKSRKMHLMRTLWFYS